MDGLHEQKVVDDEHSRLRGSVQREWIMPVARAIVKRYSMTEARLCSGDRQRCHATNLRVLSIATHLPDFLAEERWRFDHDFGVHMGLQDGGLRIARTRAENV